MWLLVALVTILVTIPIYCEDINYSDRKYINDNTEDLEAYDPMQDEPPTFIRQKLEEDVSKVSIRYLLTTCSSKFVILNFQNQNEEINLLFSDHNVDSKETCQDIWPFDICNDLKELCIHKEVYTKCKKTCETCGNGANMEILVKTIFNSIFITAFDNCDFCCPL